MKKLLVLFLVVVIGISFIGCEAGISKKANNNEYVTNTERKNEVTQAENAIIGTWVDESGQAMTYNANHTGTNTYFSSYTEGSEVKYRERQREFRWKYDEELKCYILIIKNGSSAVVYSEIYNNDGKDCLEFIGNKFFRQDANN